MVTSEDIRKLPTEEKLRMMELLWADLSLPGNELDSPLWHREALLQTAQRVAEGSESALDWNTAKKILRSERE